MKRTRGTTTKTVDAIICSDLHLTEQTPVCRTDDYEAVQVEKLIFISDLQRKYDCPVLCAGDIFDHWKPSPYLISLALRCLPEGIQAIPGQHDLSQHNLDLIEKSGFHALIVAKKINRGLKGTRFGEISYGDFAVLPIPFGEQIPSIKKGDDGRVVIMLHQLTWQKEPWPGADPKGNAKKLLKENPDFDLIITGDNHQAFTETYKGRLLVNPGSMLRKTADQIDFKPRVYLWNVETNTVIPEYLPIKNGVVSREHIDAKEKRKKQLESFINVILNKHPEMKEGDFSLSFRANVLDFLKQTKIPSAVESKILEALDCD